MADPRNTQMKDKINSNVKFRESFRPFAPSVLEEFADKLEGCFEIKGGFMDGRVLSLDEINALASIPALPVLQAQVLGTMLAPISSLACVIKAIAEKLGGPVEEPAAE